MMRKTLKIILFSSAAAVFYLAGIASADLVLEKRLEEVIEAQELAKSIFREKEASVALNWLEKDRVFVQVTKELWLASAQGRSADAVLDVYRHKLEERINELEKSADYYKGLGLNEKRVALLNEAGQLIDEIKFFLGN